MKCKNETEIYNFEQWTKGKEIKNVYCGKWNGKDWVYPEHGMPLHYTNKYGNELGRHPFWAFFNDFEFAFFIEDGDYLIYGPDGTVERCDPDSFEKIYEII